MGLNAHKPNKSTRGIRRGVEAVDRSTCTFFLQLTSGRWCGTTASSRSTKLDGGRNVPRGEDVLGDCDDVRHSACTQRIPYNRHMAPRHHSGYRTRRGTRGLSACHAWGFSGDRSRPVTLRVEIGAVMGEEIVVLVVGVTRSKGPEEKGSSIATLSLLTFQNYILSSCHRHLQLY